jgi:hypothetical protein
LGLELGIEPAWRRRVRIKEGKGEKEKENEWMRKNMMTRSYV